MFGTNILLVTAAPDRTFDIWDSGDLVDLVEEPEEHHVEIVRRNERGMWVKLCSIFLWSVFQCYTCFPCPWMASACRLTVDALVHVLTLTSAGTKEGKLLGTALWDLAFVVFVSSLDFLFDLSHSQRFCFQLLQTVIKRLPTTLPT